MRIVVINKEKLSRIPPLISVVEILKDMGHSVCVVTGGINDIIEERFRKENIDYVVIPNYETGDSYVSKVLNVIKYRRIVKKYLKNAEFDLLWIEGYGVYRWAANIFVKYPYIMQISELYGLFENKRIQSNIKKLIKTAKAVVLPELNRAVLYQIKYDMINRPFVMPNKPYFYLDGEDWLRCLQKYSKELEVFRKKKVILYQGIIHKERDLSNYIKAVDALGDEYRLVLLGEDWGALDEYKKQNPELIHIDFIPAPDYLVFTAHAYAGIVTYDPLLLNCAYCAPNKIYEYGKYGIPMIGNDIPGLRYTVGNAGAGIIVDEKSEESIKNGILLLNEKYDEYSRNAKLFFENTDNVSQMKLVLDSASC